MSDPANPVLPSNGFNCYDGDNYVHDAQCVIYNGPDSLHAGKDICFCYNEDTLTIVDVDDPNDITELSKTGYLASQYTHQVPVAHAIDIIGHSCGGEFEILCSLPVMTHCAGAHIIVK